MTISKKEFIIGCLIPIIAIAVLCWMAYSATAQADALREENNALRVQKDQTLLMDQIDELKREKEDLRLQLGIAQQEVDSTDSRLLGDIRNLISVAFTRDYTLYTSEAFFNDLYEQLTPLCTDNGYLHFCPEQDFSWISEPLGTDNPDAVPIYAPDYTQTQRVGTPQIYTSKNEDGSYSVIVLFEKKSCLTYAGVDGDDLDIESSDVELLNMRMVYDAALNRWLADRVYSDGPITGVLMEEIR